MRPRGLFMFSLQTFASRAAPVLLDEATTRNTWLDGLLAREGFTGLSRVRDRQHSWCALALHIVAVTTPRSDQKKVIFVFVLTHFEYLGLLI